MPSNIIIYIHEGRKYRFKENSIYEYKKNRDIIGLSQEKLADKTGISVNMIKDIEGCRTWVSDKTLIKLAIALNTDIYRLFISPEIYEEEIYKSIAVDLVRILKKVKKDVGIDIEKALDMWGLE